MCLYNALAPFHKWYWAIKKNEANFKNNIIKAIEPYGATLTFFDDRYYGNSTLIRIVDIDNVTHEFLVYYDGIDYNSKAYKTASEMYEEHGANTRYGLFIFQETIDCIVKVLKHEYDG